MRALRASNTVVTIKGNRIDIVFENANAMTAVSMSVSKTWQLIEQLIAQTELAESRVP